MFTLKQAFEKAKKDIIEIYGNSINDIRIEEIDFEAQAPSTKWTFIVSFLYPNADPISSSFTGPIPFQSKYERLYKKVVVKKDSGEVLAVKIFKQ